MPGETAWVMVYAAVLGCIVLVDARLGDVAEYLNAYELIRHSIGIASDPRPYVLQQTALGPWATGVAWLLFLAEGAGITAFLWCASLPWR